ncbi:hypothetical protein OE88DRAFT_1667443 [Heliocybe sulcata]|uniref:SWIM-type domain-containing protein n=1 Tax=Heliocybe sulcata TaxID=5364 RepID=A0A5C3MM29_9AGAM|nr:hypothetical protein OE88DRAFT_1667443 [Heliocybe sulcata]
MSGNKPSKRSRPIRRQQWISVTPEEARGDKVALPAIRQAAGIYTDRLVLNTGQRKEIEDLYHLNTIEDHQFQLQREDQVRAGTVLASLGLDFDTRVSMRYRWTSRWVDTSGKGSEKSKRILYQCQCSYDHNAKGVKKRRVPFDYTGCIAHVEVTYHVASDNVLRIRGCLKHNKECQNAQIARFPTMPLHPSVYQQALQQLRDGATLTDIQQKNHQLMTARAYPGQPKQLAESPYRWILKQSDTRSLYRQFNRIQGIKVRDPAHINIDKWLDPDSPEYNKTLADAVFHYSPRVEKGDRFEICIATEEMRDAAWQYAHASQVILDGTFGVCNKKLLLFILMGVDTKGRGVPLAFLLFSAPSGNKQTSAGYNTEVIARLLDEWRVMLGRRDGDGFQPLVAITDTDLMERGALIQVFLSIWLLICKFHLRQSWRNHRNRLLKGTSPAHMTAKARLRRVEEALVTTLNIQDARAIIEHERQFFAAMLEGPNAGIAKNALVHLVDYLLGYWIRDDLWCSWSDYGRQMAAQIMKCLMEGVLPTANHLESFNGVLKRKYLRRLQRGGRLLREDELFKLFVIIVLPSIFEQRTLEDEEDVRRATQISQLPGGSALLASRAGTGHLLALPPVTYHTPDVGRDLSTLELLENSQIGIPSFTDDGLTFECYSSLATDFDPSPMKYSIFLGFAGVATCQCKDFAHRGGACKHIRAALLFVDQLRRTKFSALPAISLPATPEIARALQASLLPSVREQQGPNALERAAADVERTLQEIAVEDDQEADDIATLGEDFDDTESVATDAPEDTDTDGGHNTESIMYGFTDLPIWGNMKAGIDQQAVSRVFYELSQMAPKLADMAFYLKGVNSTAVDDVANAVTFRSHIALLTDQLDRLILDSSPPATSTVPAISAPEAHVPTRSRPSTPPPPNKRSWHDIIAASPEKAQKRHQSYGHN